MNSSRTTIAATLAATVSASLVGGLLGGALLGGTVAQAAPDLADAALGKGLSKGISKSKVATIARREAGKVVDQRAASLSVAQAKNANALGNRPASAYLTAKDLVAASSTEGWCDPDDESFVDCASLYVDLARPSRLHLVSETPFAIDSASGYGDCRLTIDGVVLQPSVVNPGGDYDGTMVSDEDSAGYGFTWVTEPYAPGSYEVVQQCNEQAGDIEFNNPSLSVLAIPSA
jgi:hypothetical protein